MLASEATKVDRLYSKKTLPTYFATERHLSFMDALMRFERPTVGKLFPTLVTAVSFLSSMDELVRI